MPVGVDEAIEALAEAHPFVLAPEPETSEEKDPFKTPSGSSGRVMNGKKKPLQTALSRSDLAKKYPALGR